MRNRKVFLLVISAMAVAINMVLGTLVSRLQIPLLFLDTIGTIFIAALYGPWYGAAVGTITNVLTPILSGNAKDIPFFIVSLAVGLIVGFMAKKYKFGLVPAIATGIILSVVCPLIGAPIVVWLYGGITGSGNDFIFTWLKNSGMDIFSSAFIPRITGNIIDKIGSCLIVALAIRKIPAQYKSSSNLSA